MERGNQTSSEEPEREELRKQILDFAKKLLQIGTDIQLAHGVGQSSVQAQFHSQSGGGGDSPPLPSYLAFIQTAKYALNELVEFLESPLGKTTTVLLSKHSDQVWGLAISLTQVTAGVLVTNLFLDMAHELQSVNERELEHVRVRVENSITFVEETLPKISEAVEQTAAILKRIRENNPEEEQLTEYLAEFEDNIELANVDIRHCEEQLKLAGKEIEGAMAEINAHIILDGVVRGAIVTVGGIGIYYMIQNKMVNLPTGLCMGAVGLYLCFVRIRPRYRDERSHFMKYKATQKDLQIRLKNLKAKLEVYKKAVNRKYPVNQPA